MFYVGRVNGQISHRAEIQTPNFQLQYLLQLYTKNLTIVLESFTGTQEQEWVDADLGALWIESEQMLLLKVGCLNFGPVRGSATYPTNACCFLSSFP